MKLLLLDNYDSFTYNLAHLVEKVSNIKFDVIRNDKISLADVNNYSKILLSPGPGLPKDSGIMPALLKRYYSSKSIFGVCLGLQAIGETFGATLQNLETVYHGISKPVILVNDDKLFNNCPKMFSVGRYHSWVIKNENLPPDFIVTAIDDKNHIMAAKHRNYDVRGVQFHPESILSEHGEMIMRNWLNA